MSGRSPRWISAKWGTTLGDLAEGDIVKLNESGSPVEFLVAKHNYEPVLNGFGRTLLVRNEAHSSRAFNSDKTQSRYAGSDLDTWLINTYIKTLDQSIQALAGGTNIYATMSRNDGSNIEIITRSVFILSAIEWGYTPSEYSITDGTLIPTTKELYGGIQWTRSRMGESGGVWTQKTKGFQSQPVSGEYSVRQALALASSIPVSAENLIV